MDLNLQPEKIEVIAVASDGGTQAIDISLNGVTHNLFSDNRINTKTPNEIYSMYPGDEDAEMLDPNSILVKSIKEFLESENA